VSSRVADERLIYVVDDDVDLAHSLVRFLRRHGFVAEPFSAPDALLTAYASRPAACVIADVMMGELDGFALAEALREYDGSVAILFMTAWPTTSAAVDAVRRHKGIDYLGKPLDQERLLSSLEDALKWSVQRRSAALRLAALTSRERQVFSLLIRGHSSKAIAIMLGISARTVEDHRAHISLKTGAKTIAELIALNESTSDQDSRL
jgi:FixJ family two-component response regulator